MSDNLAGNWQTRITNLDQGVKKIYETKEFSDIIFIVEDEHFKAHKLVLASRSSMFASMLLDSNCPDEIIFTDDGITVTGFKILLRYVYTDQIGTDDKKSIVEAYLAAKHFEQEKLIRECDRRIETWIITGDEVCMLLDVGLSVPLLTNRCLTYIRAHSGEVIDSPSFLNISYSCMNAILENGALNDVPDLKRIEKIMEWASRRHTVPVKYELVRQEFENNTPPILSKLGFQTLSLPDLTTIVGKYKNFLNSLEVLAFVEHFTDPAVPLPAWCTPIV